MLKKIYQKRNKRYTRRQLFNIGLEFLQRSGWTVEAVPGNRKHSIRRITQGENQRLVAICTTQAQKIAFTRDEASGKWKTLSEVDEVLIVSAGGDDAQRHANIHLVPGDDLRNRFDRAYEARRELGKLGQFPKLGVWIPLYKDEDQRDSSLVGAGIGNAHPPIKRVRLKATNDIGGHPGKDGPNSPISIAEAKRRIALGLDIDQRYVRVMIEA